jgi:pSer/pThr/pTyr-binding forkhead associated (FHA) protein
MSTEQPPSPPASDPESRDAEPLDTFDTWAQVLRQSGLLGGTPAAPGSTAAAPSTPAATGQPAAQAPAGQALAASPTGPPSDPAPTMAASVAPRTSAAADTPLYRPVHRPPMALLHMVDDGRDGGETFRIRGGGLRIGRDGGDVVVPHDRLVSTPHASIELSPEGHWLLTDLGSASGTFVRVMRARLHADSEVILGGTRLRLRMHGAEAWLVEHLSEAIAGSRPTPEERLHALRPPGSTIGRRGHGCTIELDDPFVSPSHAECTLTPRGWQVRNLGVNGLWVRIGGPVPLREPSQFLCGEQRFVFEPLR